METTLTPEQSAALIAKGISADKASERIMRQSTDYKGNPLPMKKRWKDCKPYDKSLTMPHVGMTQFEHKDIFTLADLVGLLPKKIGTNNLYIDFLSNGKVESGYRGERKSFVILHLVIGDELIDALYELLLWTIDNRYANLTK